MIVVDSEALTSFLNDELKTRSNADPKSLSRYVVALLKKKRNNEKQLRNCLLEALDVFLGKQTIEFVDILLNALRTESYIHNTHNASGSNEDSENFDKTKKPMDEMKISGISGIPPSHTKDNENEKRNPIESAEGALSANQRCKAYDEVGYCMAGSSCSYFHGNDALVVDDVLDIFPNKNAVMIPAHNHDIIPPLPSQCFTLPPLPPEPPVCVNMYPTHPVPEAYNPEHPAISASAHNPIVPLTRKRELVFVPNNSTVIKERETHTRKSFDYNRLGPKPTKILKTGTTERDKVVGGRARFLNPSEAQCAFRTRNAPKSSFDIEKESKFLNCPKKAISINSKFHPALNKRLALLKRKDGLLRKQINNYKLILEKATHAKTNKKELDYFLKNLSSKIHFMKNELKKEYTELKSLVSRRNREPSYMHSETSLLDAELDFYHSKSLLRPSKSSDETNKDLLTEVNELKEKAEYLGLYEKDPPGPQSPSLTEPNSSEVSVQDEQPSTEQTSNISKSNSLLLGDDEEEDDEEDSEARSWRR